MSSPSSVLNSSRFATILLLAMCWGASGFLFYVMAQFQMLVWLSLLPVGLARAAIALFLSPVGPLGATVLPAAAGGVLAWKRIPLWVLAVPPVLLLGFGCSKVRIDTQGTTPYVYELAHAGNIPEMQEQLLIHMARFGQPQELRALLEAGVDVNATDPHGGTALSWTSDPDIVATLLEAGASPTDGAIASAAFWGSPERLDLLLQSLEEEGRSLPPETASDILFTLSSVGTGATDAERAAMAQRLLDLGANPNTTDEQGNSVLMEASEMHYAEVVKVLLKAGANPNYQNSAGDTALHWALSLSMATGRGPATVEALLAGNADPTLRNRDGKTAGDRLQEGLAQVEAEASRAKPADQALYEGLRQDYRAIAQQIQTSR